MSKRRKRKKPNSPARKPGKRPREAVTSKVSFTFRDKLLLISPVLVGTVVTFAILMRSPDKAEEEAIRQRVNNWKVEYALSESVAKELLEVEKDFHLSDSYFSTKQPPTPEEIEAHQQSIKSLLGSDEYSH